MERRDRRRFLFNIAGLVIGLKALPAQAIPSDDSIGGLFWPKTKSSHISTAQFDAQHWVSQALIQMQTIRVGMTRSQMEGVFGQAGGAYATRTTAPLIGVYSYRECPNFKVEVEFQPTRQPVQSRSGDVWTPEDPGDVITKISKPYLETVFYD